ncbi:MAG: glycosyltransferase family 2 protein [Marinomonas sp.]|uniref:glycosyltransferase family 2 protein n=1 Tax=Marinomonas sp. TaxID=1904862 RepID=UPI003C719D8A
MKISVITIVYNDAKGIIKTLDSIYLQRQYVDEYIIIDGGSTDGTVDVINQSNVTPDVFITESDKGIYNAMNKGWRLASEGNHIIFVNSSDYLENNICKNLVESKIDRFDIVHGLARFIKNDEVLYVQGRDVKYLSVRMIEHPTCLVRKNVFIELNGFDELYKLSSDYDFMLRAKAAGFKFKFIEKIISNFDLGGASSNSILGAIETLKIKYKYNMLSKSSCAFRILQLRVTKLMKSIVK